MIHGGLVLSLQSVKSGTVNMSSCCLHPKFHLVNDTDAFWESPMLTNLREKNIAGVWDDSCYNCQNLENAGIPSYRQGMIEQFGERYNLSGPLKLDLTLSNSCNLACRTCGPMASTFWQKHLKNNKLPIPILSKESLPTVEYIAKLLQKFDLSNLEVVLFAGGETLMGNDYWKVLEFIIDAVPHAKEKLTVCFQTNGTQPIDKKRHSLLERVRLVKIHISIDGIERQFEYLRWPAKWEHFVSNIFSWRDNLPPNVMFVLEETVSIFNLMFMDRLENWAANNFSTNLAGDPTIHSRHLAMGTFALDGLTSEYVDSLPDSTRGLLPSTFRENPKRIKDVLDEIKKFDDIRGENWGQVFPELLSFYSRYV